MTGLSWTRIDVRVGRQASEAVANFLMELGSPGLEVEEVGEEIILRAYLRGNSGGFCRKIRRYLAGLKALNLTVGEGEPKLSPLEDTDWLATWRARLRPLRVGRRFLIKPSWIEEPAPGDLLVVVIDPQMAFGTGEHSTTQFCLRVLEELVRPGDIILDVGTGSGILSIAAVKLGARRVLGLDVDPQAIATARENARMNGVAPQVDLTCLSLNQLEGKSFDLVVANIDGQTLLPLLPELARVMKPRGRLVLAGFLAEEEKALQQGLHHQGLCSVRIKRQGEWISAVATGQRI